MTTREDISRMLTRLVLGNKAWGVELQMAQDGVVTYSASLLRKQKDGLDIAQTIQTGDVERLLKQVKQTPVVMLITGKGIISRKGTSSGASDVAGILPGADPETLTVRSYPNADASWLNVAKTETINQYLEPFREAHAKIIRIELGGSYLLKHTRLFQEMPEALGKHQYDWADGALERYQLQAESPDNALSEQQFYGESLSFTLSILCAMEFFGRTLNQAFQTDRMKEFTLFRVRKASSIAVLASLLLLLIGNFLVLQSTRSNVVELQSQVDQLTLQNEASLASHKSVLSDLSLYKNLRGDAELSYAEIMESIAQCVPDDVELSALNIHPVLTDRRRKKGEEVQFNKQRVILGGSAEDIAELNILIDALSELSWVSETKLVDLTHEDKSDLNLFELHVTL